MRLKIVAPTLVALIVAPATAQWLNYPTPGIPRTPDGKANLSAPAPRAADGKPDLSGIWHMEVPCPAGNCDSDQAAREFLNIAVSLKDGLPYRPGMAELAKARRQPPKRDEPLTNCLPIGIVERYTHVTFRKIVQTPGLLLMLNEHNKSYRQIFTDGRPLPIGPAAFLGWLLDRQVGWRCPRGSNHRLSRRHLAGCFRRSHDRCRQDHRALSPRRLRPSADRSHGRRPQGLHPALDRDATPDSRARYRLDRLHLSRKRERPETPGEMKLPRTTL